MAECTSKRCRLVVERAIPSTETEGQTLTLDVWRPDDDVLRPGVLHDHRRRLASRLRSNFDNLAGILASWGYVVCNTSYRVAPTYRWPAPLQDVKTALRWWRAHAEHYQLDVQRIASFGSSAGGHLSAMLAMTPGNEPFGGDKYLEHSAAVQAAVCLCAPVDMKVQYDGKDTKQILIDLFGGTPNEMPEQYRQASPVNYLSSDAPPTLFIHGEQDATVPIEPTQKASERLVELGAESQFIALPEVAHGVRLFMIAGGDASPLPEVQHFLACHLGAKRPANAKE